LRGDPTALKVRVGVVSMETALFRFEYLRAVLIGCYGSVAKKWALLPGMS
jgi:hypothetical protein